MEDKGWPIALLCPPFSFAMLLLILSCWAHVSARSSTFASGDLPRGESVVEPPSHCPRCNTRLQALDLVPLWSQVFLARAAVTAATAFRGATSASSF
jgi:prepilin signal peptidase PulO-like enzyme (type II secretory pathway)